MQNVSDFPTDSPDTYLPAHTISRTIGISRGKIAALALAGRVRSIVRPGEHPRFHVEDVRAYKEEISTYPSKRQSGR